ncbi:MAG: phenylalanine--tRNA ligase subunit beta [Eubacteriales bacterium]
MIAPYSWIKDYVKTDLAPEELMKYLLVTGTGVEGFAKQGEGIENVVVGKIIKIEKHPDADKLVVCQVSVGSEISPESIQIVTGASNIKENDLVPVALVGAKLPNGMKIKKGKLRGVESFGMLCSGEELKLTEADYEGAGVYGILILKGDLTLGEDIKTALGMDDVIFEFETEANRPDMLSMIGISREVAASIDAPLHLPEINLNENNESIDDYVKVTVENPEYCPRYMARAVKNIKMGPSPAWMQKRLKSAGVRPISNIVDITNFVMLEMGQPMHAFDAEDIGGKHIIVRTAKPGETIVTLDDKERKLSERNLLICDANHPIGIAGIMGGQNSEIKETTKTVIFESAMFTYGNIRQSSRELGMSTDASMRFSKGVDAVGAKAAVERACALVEELGAGEIVGGEIDILNMDLTPATVEVTPEKVNALLGTDISIDDMTKYLNRLYIDTTHDGKVLKSTIPSFRSMDMSQGADIAEEVARMFGYDNIEESMMTGAVVRGQVPQGEKYNDRLKSLLIGSGFFEASTFSFSSKVELDKLNLDENDELYNMVKILNPLGEEFSCMRTTMVPDMLKNLSRNINMKEKNVRLFEVAKTFTPIADEPLPLERPVICLGIAGDAEDFYSLKGVVENIAEIFGTDIKLVPGGANFYHPGRKAEMMIKKTVLGEMGEIHPDIRANFDIDERVYVAQIFLDSLYDAADDFRVYKPLPKYPAAERDLALIVKDGVTAGSLLACIQKNGGKFLESVKLFDVYKGKPLQADQKSLAFSMMFRAADRTLTDEEVNAAMAKIMDSAKKDFDAEIRQ